MLDNTFTLQADLENDGGTLTDILMTRIEEYLNRSVYKGPDHTLVSRDTLGFYRTAPKKVGNFNGVAKSSVKSTHDHTVAGVDSSTTLTSPIIIETNFSIPVGVTHAQVLAARQRHVALLDLDAIMTKLNEGLEI
jgi:hypothetical protein